MRFLSTLARAPLFALASAVLAAPVAAQIYAVPRHPLPGAPTALAAGDLADHARLGALAADSGPVSVLFAGGPHGLLPTVS